MKLTATHNDQTPHTTMRRPPRGGWSDFSQMRPAAEFDIRYGHDLIRAESVAWPDEYLAAIGETPPELERLHEFTKNVGRDLLRGTFQVEQLIEQVDQYVLEAPEDVFPISGSRNSTESQESNPAIMEKAG